MRKNPTVSVIMSVFNGERYLTEAVASILAQTFTDFEFLIANDGSSDGTSSILSRFSSDGRVRVIGQSNIGLTKTLNMLVGQSKGTYIARMDADDIALPDRLQKQLEYMQNNSFDLIGANCDIIDDKGIVIKKKDIVLPSDQKELKRLLFITNRFTHSTLFGTREVFMELYNDTFTKAQDYEFLLRVLGKAYRLGHLQESVLMYRFHKGSISLNNARQQEYLSLRARWLALRKYGYDLSLLPLFLQGLLMFLIPPRVKYFIVYKLR